tara:strand:- start:1737 stop:2330 length:594 start_codon:yes stop_codon:yes gene_type:complete
MKVTPYQVYTEYLALKNHFSNPKYDYFKYNKKVRATITSFNKRRDKYFFEKTSRKYNDEDIVNFLVANFVESTSVNQVWIGEIISSGERTYADWTKRQQSLTYLFKEQSNELLSNNELENLFSCSKGHPTILKRFLGGDISLETFVIYDRIFSFRKKFDKKLKDPVWETVSLKIQKYSPFLQIDIFKFKKILRDIVE